MQLFKPLVSTALVAGADIEVWLDVSEGSSESSGWLPLRHPQTREGFRHPYFRDFSHVLRLQTLKGAGLKDS